MKIKPGMLCVLVGDPTDYSPRIRKYIGQTVVVDKPLGGIYNRWVTTAGDGFRMANAEEHLRPLPPPPMPAKEEERELVV